MTGCLSRRLLAFLLDVALAYAVFLPLAWLWPGAAQPLGADPAPLLLALTYAVRALPELLWRRSPGKMVLRLEAAGPRWAPLVRHLWLLLPIPPALMAPAVPWYSLIAVGVGASAFLSRDNRSVADRAARSTVVQRGVGCSLPS